MCHGLVKAKEPSSRVVIVNQVPSLFQTPPGSQLNTDKNDSII